jgi:hypothetical protein
MSDAATWPRWEVPGFGLSLCHPPGWRRVPVVAERMVHLVAPHAGPEVLRPTATVQVLPPHPTDGADLDDLVERQVAVSATVYDDLLILDAERTMLAGVPARRVRLHHLVGAQSVTLDQWFLRPGRRVIVVSATSASADVPARRLLLAPIVGSLEVRGVGANA